MQKLRVGVVGVGYLGKFHAQKYGNMPDVELVGVVDADDRRIWITDLKNTFIGDANLEPHAARVRAAIEESGVSCEVFDSCRPEPTTEAPVSSALRMPCRTASALPRFSASCRM